MRRLLTVLVLAAAAVAVSGPAWAGNQEVADRIAASLRDSGSLSNYKIQVRYQKGTAWLKGRVRDQAQMNSALKLALQTNGVTRVVNGLAVGSGEAAPPTTTTRSETVPAPSVATRTSASKAPRTQRTGPTEWLKKVVSGDRQQLENAGSSAQRRTAGRAQRVPSSYMSGQVTPVAAMQPANMPRQMVARSAGRPIPIAYTQAAPAPDMGGGQMPGRPMPAYVAGTGGGVAPARYDQPHLPNYSWPSYAAYPNYAALTYPRQYSPTAWPYIGPFYPYPQVPLGWRKVTLEWDDGWWMLDFKNTPSCCCR